MSSFTGYEYRRHLGCNHPVRYHTVEGCSHYNCDCTTTRSRLTTPASPFWNALDWACRLIGAGFLLWHGGSFLIGLVMGWLP